MRAHLPCLGVVLLGVVSGALGQTNDPISDIVSQALSVYTEVRSMLTATTTSSSTTSTSTRSSTLTTSSSSTTATPTATSSQSASNTAEAAAASSSAAAAMAAANAQTKKNRTTAIALGVVLGLLALAALIGMLLFCLRRRRRQQAKGSRRSVSPEAVGGASWGKEPLTHTSTFGKPTPGHVSATEHHRTPVTGAAPPMTENALNTHGGPGATNDRTPIPHRGAPGFQPGLVNGAPPGPRPHQGSPNHIPLSSHSRSNVAAAGLGGAALGAMAAKHHRDKHDARDFGHQSHDHNQGIARKPVRGQIGDGGARHSTSMGVGNDSAPGYQSGHSGPHHGDMKTSPVPAGPGNIPSTGSPLGNANPPAYNGSAHPLSSHPPFADTYRHSTGHEPLMTGAAAAGAGAIGAAAHEKHHDGNRDQGSSLTGRRSWDPSKPSQHPQSILPNPTGRRSIGSTNPYVPARSPANTRFSGDMTEAKRHSHDGQNRSPDNDLSQNNPYPRMEHRESPKLISPISDEVTTPRHGSPRHNIPGGWRGSGEWDRNNNGNRSSFSNDNPKSNNQTADLRPRGPSLSDLRQQEEEDQWYRGRYIGDRKSADLSKPGYDSRFYADKRVGQAL